MLPSKRLEDLKKNICRCGHSQLTHGSMKIIAENATTLQVTQSVPYHGACAFSSCFCPHYTQTMVATQ